MKSGCGIYKGYTRIGSHNGQYEIPAPRNLVGIPGDNKVELIWDELLEIDEYRVYRDGSYIASSLTNGYIDLTVENGTLYQYYVTAIYSDTGEESIPSNVVNVTPMPPIGLPLIIDFENGAPYWEFEGSWGSYLYNFILALTFNYRKSFWKLCKQHRNYRKT